AIIWAFELGSAGITRTIFRRVFKHSISKDAAKDFDEYPEMALYFVVVINKWRNALEFNFAFHALFSQPSFTLFG
ncbi:13990_t:CDS:2, partial [Dentiscutata heterogama]